MSKGPELTARGQKATSPLSVYSLSLLPLLFVFDFELPLRDLSQTISCPLRSWHYKLVSWSWGSGFRILFIFHYISIFFSFSVSFFSLSCCIGMTLEHKDDGAGPSPVRDSRFLEAPEGPPATSFTNTLQRFRSYLFTMKCSLPFERRPWHYHFMFRHWLTIFVLCVLTSHDFCNVSSS